MSASDMARAAANSAGRVVTGGRVSGEVSGGGDDVTGGTVGRVVLGVGVITGGGVVW